MTRVTIRYKDGRVDDILVPGWRIRDLLTIEFGKDGKKTFQRREDGIYEEV